MICECGCVLKRDPEIGPDTKTTSWGTCAYRCTCGLGYSNARSPQSRTRVTKDPRDNVPAEVVDGLTDALEHAVNVTNRGSKRQKFCFSTSEDAVTWTVFRFLQQTGLLDRVAGVTGITVEASQPEFLLWGGYPDEKNLADDVVAVSDACGEKKAYRTEPDVILAWPDAVIFVEAKYRSPNDVKPDHEKFPMYLDRSELFSVDTKCVAAEGYYELVRNWRLGVELAERRDASFVLLNLGTKVKPVNFVSQLAQTPARRFEVRQWSDLLAGLVLPTWMKTFVKERKLI